MKRQAKGASIIVYNRGRPIPYPDLMDEILIMSLSMGEVKKQRVFYERHHNKAVWDNKLQEGRAKTDSWFVIIISWFFISFIRDNYFHVGKSYIVTGFAAPSMAIYTGVLQLNVRFITIWFRSYLIYHTISANIQCWGQWMSQSWIINRRTCCLQSMLITFLSIIKDVFLQRKANTQTIHCHPKSNIF